MTLEALGIATVNLVTDAFEALFLSEARQQGVAAIPYVVIPHPLGGIRESAAREKARAVADDVLRALMEPVDDGR